MLAFSIVLHTVRLIRGELTFCHKLLRRFCRGGQNLAVLIALWDLSVSMPQSDSPYSCPSSSYVSKILLAFLLRYRKQTAFFEHTLQFGSIKLCECTIFFAGKCSHYTGMNFMFFDKISDAYACESALRQRPATNRLENF